MVTRFKTHIKNKQNYGVDSLPTGFGGATEPDIIVPSCGLEDVDIALFKLFDKELNLQIGEPQTKIPIVFASGEKWAILKKGRALRDKNNTLILPLITIVRTSVKQDVSTDINGRGINQQTGEIVITRRLDVTDRKYQDLINRLLLKNQKSLSVIDDGSQAIGQLTSERTLGDLASDDVITQGGLLGGDKKNNVYETLVIPSPQFFSAQYDITIWTQYTQQMNQVIEHLISSYLPQVQGWRLDTDKGYWFVATVDGSSWQTETNIDDMSQTERLIKQKFTVTVPAYILATSSPGTPVPVKRYVSSPSVSFNVSTGDIRSDDVVDEPFLGNDDPTLPIEEQKNKRRDQRKTGRGAVFVQNNVNMTDPNDPALQGYPRGTTPNMYRVYMVNGKKKYVKVNSAGESIMPRGTDFNL